MGTTRTLTKALTAASANNIALAQSLGAAGNLTLNGSTVSGGIATLDTARRVLITSVGNDSGKTWTVTGTGGNGVLFSETLAGANATTVQSVNDFATITRISLNAATAGNVTVGTSAVGSTQPWVVDVWANPATFGYQIVVTGTATYNIEGSLDDLSPQWDVNNNIETWNTLVDGSTGTSTKGTLNGPATMIRLTVTSGTGTVTAKFVQPFIAGRY